MKNHAQQSGITLFELLIVMAIAGILAMIAAPSMTEFVRNSRLNSTAMMMVGDLNLARGEAIKRNARVLICSGGQAGCNGSLDWAASGWIVCYDINNDAICDPAPANGSAPNPIQVRAPVSASGLVLAGPAAPIVYRPNGAQGVQGGPLVALNISGTWPNSKQKVVSIAPTGNITSH